MSAIKKLLRKHEFNNDWDIVRIVIYDDETGEVSLVSHDKERLLEVYEIASVDELIIYLESLIAND